MYDPSAPIRLKDGTWHMYPDGCDGGWCHYSSPDLFHWTQHAPLGKLGGLTGSISYAQEDELLLLHPKGGDWIGRAVPNGTDRQVILTSSSPHPHLILTLSFHSAHLDDFDDSRYE